MSNYSPKLPLKVDSSNGFSNNQTISEVALQNLKMLILTSPGERIMDPNFGVGMRNYVFEQNNLSTYASIRAKIRKQVQEYLPYIDIVDVLFETEQNNNEIISNQVLIKIRFIITPTGSEEVLEISPERLRAKRSRSGVRISFTNVAAMMTFTIKMASSG